jgi:hypothetical protein
MTKVPNSRSSVKVRTRFDFYFIVSTVLHQPCSEAITMLEVDKRFNAVEHSGEREALVENYLAELQKKVL